jgi:hypothetical protein
MADFGTILNPNNKTLNLYCNSIITEEKIKNPFLYASLEPYTLNTQIDQPLIFNNIINYKINLNQVPRITFTDDGIYLLTASVNGASTFNSVFNPAPYIQFKLYDISNNLIQTSSGLGIDSYGFNEAKNISQTFTASIHSGRYIIVILGISGAPPQFNIIFDAGNLNITKISN